MSSSLDIKKFSHSIKLKRGNVGLRTLATEIGVSASTLSRIEQGNLPDIDTYLKLCEWLEVTSDFFTTSAVKNDNVNVIAHLRADKNLPPKTAEALIQMINLAYAATIEKHKI